MSDRIYSICGPGCKTGTSTEVGTVQKMHERLLKLIALELARLEAAIAALIRPRRICRARRISRACRGWQARPRQDSRDDAGSRPGQPKDRCGLVRWSRPTTTTAPTEGERHVEGGRRRLRNTFYMACLGASTRHNPMLMAFYRRLLANGKEPKVALVACMRKLIGILNTMIARRQKWDASLQNA